MAHLILAIPEDQNYYSTPLTVRVTDINGANQLGKTLIAMAKSGFVFFNYKRPQIVAMPDDFRAKFPKVNWID